MYALSGRVDGNTIVVNENIARYEGCNVVITILDYQAVGNGNSSSLTRDQKKALREEAARGLAGLWASHSDEQSVEETVRMIRRGRQFDS